ncbi:MAG: cytochrome d ubiquinol oxidase subunit II, partial [Actinomycetota bacterium]|nr:cytochrome d ubiquinol oxidase subunit II [Actinomycetota bacterium]
MILADALLAAMWAGLTAYVLFGGADFGGGFWDLVAGRSRPGMPQRKLIEHSIGPVWETNHVWLIFVIVLLWTGFPTVYAALAATMIVPLTLAALDIIARGAAFAFRKVSEELGQQRLFGAAFAFSSVVTPFFLGTVAGGIASGRVLPATGESDLVTSWWNPTSVVTGLLAVAVGAYLAAVFLTRDAQRHAPELVSAFRRRALAAGLVTGSLAAVGLLALRADAPWLFARLSTGWPAALAGVSVLAGVGSLSLLPDWACGCWGRERTQRRSGRPSPSPSRRQPPWPWPACSCAGGAPLGGSR